MKRRLDVELAARRLVSSRSQAESYIRLGKVKVNGKVINKSGVMVGGADVLEVLAEEQFVSRAALKLKSADEAFGIDWGGRVVLDVGSSTGGFSQYALSRGARKIIAVDVGTDQLHPTLRSDSRIELHEKTDIRNFRTQHRVDMVVADVSFISLREILPYVSALVPADCLVIAMAKPQFEAGFSQLKHKGVVKNDKIRREILRDFESWVRQTFVILDKKDSVIAGGKGNIERFYLLKRAV